jgi:hypothetical protein
VTARARRVPMAGTILLKCTVCKCFSEAGIRLQGIEGAQGGSYPFNGVAQFIAVCRSEFISIKSWATTGEDEPGIMEGTAAIPHPIADAHLPEAASVFDAATALDTAIDMVGPQPTLVERLVRHVLLPRELLPQIEINSNLQAFHGHCHDAKSRTQGDYLPVGRRDNVSGH